MGMMQAPIHQIIDMVAVGHGFMPAFRPVGMAFDAGSSVATVGVHIRNGDAMLVHMVAMGMVKVSIMQIIHMAVVPHGNVPAPGAMRMGMILMGWLVATAHALASWDVVATR